MVSVALLLLWFIMAFIDDVSRDHSEENCDLEQGKRAYDEATFRDAGADLFLCGCGCIK